MNIRKFYSLITFLFGSFSILEAFKYKIGSISIYLGDLFYYLFFILNILIIASDKCELKIKGNPKTNNLYILFFCLLLYSCNFWTPIIDFAVGGGLDGSQNAIKYAIKTIILILVLLTIIGLPTSYKKLFVKFFCYGFVAGIFIHAIYSIIQMVDWYVLGIDMHTNFLNGMGITEESVGHTLVNYLIYPVIRLSGLHWDPAYYGLWGAIGIVVLKQLKKNRCVKYLFYPIVLITWILTFSRTGYLSMIFIVLFYFFFKKRNSTLPNFNIRKLFKFISILILFAAFLILILPTDYQEMIADAFTYRFSVDLENDEGSSRHLYYPLYALESVLHDPFHFLFGFGARNSSRGIFVSGNIQDFVSHEVFDIESDLCKIIINYGIVYFFIYYYFIFRLVSLYIININFKKTIVPTLVITSIIGLLIAGVFYVYNDSKWVWLIYFIAILYLNLYENKEQYILCDNTDSLIYKRSNY